MTIFKVIVTSKTNLQNKYGSKFSAVEKLIRELIQSDKKKGITTQLVYIDDAASAKAGGITAIKSITPPTAKKALDGVYKKLRPAYLVILGAGDIIPFQPIDNPADDEDLVVPSDLPYACESGYGTDIAAFTGPTRVVGRIPDIPFQADVDYFKTIINNIIQYKQVKPEKLQDYFAVTAAVWKKSTEESIHNMFGSFTALKSSPAINAPHKPADMKPLVHFYNCHGSPEDASFYGQKGNSYPIAQKAEHIAKNISVGTVVAAECCYGASLFNPDNEAAHHTSMANTYLQHGAITFVGSSTIAYGPASGNALADLITQYFIRNIKNGASTGRAFLEARQKFLSVSGPQLDPYELKTLAQFYLLGDPSVHVLIEQPVMDGGDTVANKRMNLFNKGVNLAATVAASKKAVHVQAGKKNKVAGDARQILKQAGFTGKESATVYHVAAKNKKSVATAKDFTGGASVSFRAFKKDLVKVKSIKVGEVLVIKESGNQVLGWKIYHRK